HLDDVAAYLLTVGRPGQDSSLRVETGSSGQSLRSVNQGVSIWVLSDQRDYRGAPDAQPSFARYQRKVDRVRLDARSRFEHGRAIGALSGTGGWAGIGAGLRAEFGAGLRGLDLSACHPGRCQGTADDCHHETKVLVHGSRKPKDGSQV